MPYLKRTKENQHDCSPPNSQHGMRRAGAGSIWACAQCGQQWILELADPKYPQGYLRWRPATEAEHIPVPVAIAEKGVSA